MKKIGFWYIFDKILDFVIRCRLMIILKANFPHVKTKDVMNAINDINIEG